MTRIIDPGGMQVAVLMGGRGTRLGALGQDCPKALLPVLGKPFFAYQLDLMRRAGFRKFVFLVGYKAEMVERYFGDGEAFGVSIRYAHDGETLLGTAGAVRRALPLLEEEFLLLYGDSFMDVNYEEILYRYACAREEGKTALMTVLENAGRYDTSNALVADGRVVLYDKHAPLPMMRHIDYGICAFRRALFEALPPDAPCDLASIQSRLACQGLLACCEVAHRFYEIGTPEALASFTEYARRRFQRPGPAVFLDRDGVINHIVQNDDTDQLESPVRWDQFRFLPRAPEALRLLQDIGCWLFVVTNQPAAAKGTASLGTLYDINTRMVKHLAVLGVSIDEVRMCPHHEAGDMRGEPCLIGPCACRKPKPGMILDILDKYAIDCARSCMVGDAYTDVLAGRAAGLKTAMLGGLKCDQCQRLEGRWPDLLAKDLYDFASMWAPEERTGDAV